MKKLLTWLPRIIAILFTGMLSIFAFDAFSTKTAIWEQLIGFIIHLVPAISAAVCLLVAWRYRIVGGMLFLILGLVFTVYFGAYHSMAYFSIISLPPLVAGILFILSQLEVSGDKTSS